MPETKEYTIYTFEELSDDAKEKAREWFRQYVFTDSNDWEHVYEDAATVGELIGIDLRQRRVETIGGSIRYEPAIFFSGFWSQGDGACFEGDYTYKKGALKALKAHIGGESEGDRTLLNIAERLQRLQRKNFYRLEARMKHSGHYYHSGCMSVDVSLKDVDHWPDDSEIELKTCMRDFADWIYRQLEKEQEYQSSDEQVDENIKINEYTFDEDGNRED